MGHRVPDVWAKFAAERDHRARYNPRQFFEAEPRVAFIQVAPSRWERDAERKRAQQDRKPRSRVDITYEMALIFMGSIRSRRPTPTRSRALCAVLIYRPEIQVRELLLMRRNDPRLDGMPSLAASALARWRTTHAKLVPLSAYEFPSLELPFRGSPMTSSNLRHTLRRVAKRINWPSVSPRSLQRAGSHRKSAALIADPGRG